MSASGHHKNLHNYFLEPKKIYITVKTTVWGNKSMNAEHLKIYNLTNISYNVIHSYIYRE